MSTQPMVFEDLAAARPEEAVQKLDSDVTVEAAGEIKPVNPEPAAFAAVQLKTMIAPVRDRRTILLSDLTGLRNKIRDLEHGVAEARDQEETKKIELMQLEEWLQKCESLATLSLELEPYIKPPISGKSSPRVYSDLDFTSADCLQVFQNNPKMHLSMREIVDRVPAVKRDAARESCLIRLNYLASQGKIVRVAYGVYSLAPMPAEPAASSEVVVWHKPEAKPAYVPDDLYAGPLDETPPLRSKTVVELVKPSPKGSTKTSKNTPLAAGLLPHLRGPAAAPKSSHT